MFDLTPAQNSRRNVYSPWSRGRDEPHGGSNRWLKKNAQFDCSMTLHELLYTKDPASAIRTAA